MKEFHFEELGYNSQLKSMAHYPNAPIREALIDIRVIYDPNISLEKLKNWASDIEADYPHIANRDFIEGQIKVKGSESHAQSSRSTVGYIFHSRDRRQAVQARLDGFTFSRFAPYETWDRFVQEAQRLWRSYVASLRPSSVIRVAVRYINQINLPLKDDTLTFEHYLRTFPKIELTEDIFLEQFLIRLIMPQQDLSAKLILTETLLPAQAADQTVGVILDIDLFREDLFLDVHSHEIWEMLDKFRVRKNKFFEVSITDAARVLFA